MPKLVYGLHKHLRRLRPDMQSGLSISTGWKTDPLAASAECTDKQGYTADALVALAQTSLERRQPRLLISDLHIIPPLP